MLPLVAGLLLAGCASIQQLFFQAPDPGPWDILITGGTVVDGTGRARYPGDVAIRGNRIVRVDDERLDPALADRVIDATGRVVAPGFIDGHAHLEPVTRLREAESHVRQGVTTAIGGPDGGSPWPLGVYFDSLEAFGVGLNVGFLVGHNTLRRAVLGLEDRPPTPGELDRMREMVARAMGIGAFGLSTGLRYVPGAYSDTDEIVALARVAADSGGVYTSHLRDEGPGLIAAVAEALEVGRRAGIPVVLTHHKAMGNAMWGESRRTLAMVDSARAAGTAVVLDQYPYTATHTGLGVLVPAWAQAGGEEAFERRLRSQATRDSIVEGIIDRILNERGGRDLDRIQLARIEWAPELEGKTLADWARQELLEPVPEAGAELVIRAMRNGGGTAIYHVLDPDDVERIMRHPMTMIASDGRLTRPGEGHPHPRSYGTFPRVLGHYVRERAVISLEEAVRKMTSAPADVYSLLDRGRLGPGYVADVVVFDPETVQDRATFQEPHQYPVGIDHVLIDGAFAVENGAFLGTLHGRVLRGWRYQRVKGETP